MSSRTLSRAAAAKARGRPRLEVCVNGSAFIPSWIVDHASYRRWARSDEFPEQGRFAYLNGTIWIDLTMEQVFTHNAVKTEIASVLRALVRERQLGYCFGDGNLLSHAGAGLSTQPDGCFLAYDTVAAGKARWIAGATEGVVEIDGSPDMVLEVVSTSSVHKDTVELRKLYWQAGIAEYWLVDARGETPAFSLLRHREKGYVETRRRADGWLKSEVFATTFRLSRRIDPLGNPDFTLATKP
ncbi:MAG: Uma2 family endonuclease [Planctomycetaceae bacterium]|nr:Uma2 family endonuclease [Planctomycetaceae bacterium]